MTNFANEYGDGLYILARDERLEWKILDQAELVEKCFRDNPDFLTLLDIRTIPLQEREDVIRKAFEDSVHLYLLNFLMLLVKRGGIREFSACIQRFRDDYYRDNHISLATVTTVRPLTDAQKQKIKEKLSQVTGRKIILSERVDRSLIGGIRVDVEGRRIDNTIKTRMELLRRSLHADV
ncbi:MAG: ATP synthase F1 subunit delta [Clostridia bacterium]|nr:ATP synthase F1 subunit delta [Clostridia bacterium]